MEEPSFLSGATTNRQDEISDSNSSSPSGGPSASKFKGVVVQPNGHWGAQIYANHQRIWLGTFKSEKEAATAYDSASIKLRNGLSHRNFPWTELTLREPYFQNQFSTEAILSMIKDGSYAAKFSDFVRAQDQQGYNSITAFHETPAGGVRLRQLFQKELTPSDVSKLNRLVIPKKYALKYFPEIPDVKGDNGGGVGSVDDLELVFFDRAMRSWKLRYCYWKSSQSFVFTRGWNRFAKEKGLRPRDKVIFSSYENGEQKLCIIDVVYHVEGSSGGVVLVEDDDNGRDEDLEMRIGLPLEQPDFQENGDEKEDDQEEEEEENGVGKRKENVLPTLVDPESKKGFRLFGFQIA